LTGSWWFDGVRLSPVQPTCSFLFFMSRRPSVFPSGPSSHSAPHNPIVTPSRQAKHRYPSHSFVHFNNLARRFWGYVALTNLEDCNDKATTTTTPGTIFHIPFLLLRSIRSRPSFTDFDCPCYSFYCSAERCFYIL